MEPPVAAKVAPPSVGAGMIGKLGTTVALAAATFLSAVLLHTQFAGANSGGKIVFLRASTGSDSVGVINPDGTGERVILRSSSYGFPTEKILFSSNRMATTYRGESGGSAHSGQRVACCKPVR
jgi:hypothetical protein